MTPVPICDRVVRLSPSFNRSVRSGTTASNHSGRSIAHTELRLWVINGSRVMSAAGPLKRNKQTLVDAACSSLRCLIRGVALLTRAGRALADVTV